MRQWRIPGLHLLVTSRDTPDIRSCLEAQTNIPNTDFMLMKNRSIDLDIQDYISYKVDHERELRRWSHDDRYRIREHLAQHAGGVFRWVKCQLEPLKRCPHSRKYLENCLNTLPQSLDKTYERILCNIAEESRNDAKRILSLLCFAARPLSVSEVIEALAIDVNGTECYDQDQKLSYADDLLRICPELIEISFPKIEDDHNDSERLMDREENDNSEELEQEGWEHDGLLHTQLVRIGHFSVQEYLLSDRIQRGPMAAFALAAREHHAQIAKTCLIYLSNEDLVRPTLTPRLVQQYPLGQYAAQHWHYHYKQAGREHTKGLLQYACKLIVTRPIFDRCTQLHNVDGPWEDYISYEKRPWSQVYYMAYLGLDGVLAHVLSTCTVDVNAQRGTQGSPLYIAAQKGYIQEVQLLLENGADVHNLGWIGHTPLQAASDNGHTKVVQILLDYGANINTVKSWGGTALHMASSKGYLEVVRLLLDNGADVDATEAVCSGTALHEASVRGHENVVQFLLDRGADVNALNERENPALHLASTLGHENIVQLLLDRGTDVSHYDNALYAASGRGHKKVVQMLLSRGAEAIAETSINSALWAASEGGHEQVVQLLLDQGANVDAQGVYYYTSYDWDYKVRSSALYMASKGGHEKVVQILLDNGADVNVSGENVDTRLSDGTALCVASRGGYEKVGQMLIDKGADLNIRGSEGNALQLAVAGEHEEVVRLLLDSGADVNAWDGVHGNALYIAHQRNHEKVVQMLLGKGAVIRKPCFPSDFGYGVVIQE